MIKALVNNTKEFKIEKSGSDMLVDGFLQQWDLVKTDKNNYHIIHNHKSYNLSVISVDNETKTFELLINNKNCTVQLKDRLDTLLHDLGMDTFVTGKVLDLKAPMPGLVVDVRVVDGQQIKKGDPIVVLEAMKMENILKASADAMVKQVLVKKGSKVEKNEILITLH